MYETDYAEFETAFETTYRDAIDGQQVDASLQHPHHRGSQLQRLESVLDGSLQKG